MVRRYRSGNQRHKTKTHGRINRRVNKARKRRLQAQRKKFELFKTEIEWISHKLDQKWYQTDTRQITCNKRAKETGKRKGTKIVPRGIPVPIKTYRKPLSSNWRLEQTSSSHIPFNETSARTGERTCTEKLSIPSLEKDDSSSASLCRRKFVQYVKMTKDIDISPMVNSKEILPQYREQLETEIKDIYLWAIGQNALTEMTETVGQREPSSLPLHKSYTYFDYIIHLNGSYNTAGQTSSI